MIPEEVIEDFEIYLAEKDYSSVIAILQEHDHNTLRFIWHERDKPVVILNNNMLFADNIDMATWSKLHQEFHQAFRGMLGIGSFVVLFGCFILWRIHSQYGLMLTYETITMLQKLFMLGIYAVGIVVILIGFWLYYRMWQMYQKVQYISNEA